MSIGDDWDKMISGDLPEDERMLLEARLANHGRVAARERKAARKAQRQAEAEKMMRNGGIHRVFRAPIATREPERPAADAMRATADQCKERLVSIRARIDEQFKGLR